MVRGSGAGCGGALLQNDGVEVFKADFSETYQSTLIDKDFVYNLKTY